MCASNKWVKPISELLYWISTLLHHVHINLNEKSANLDVLIMILWISCKKNSLLRCPRFLWDFFLYVVVFCFFFSSRWWGMQKDIKKGPYVGAQGAETNRQKKTRQRSARRGNASSLTSLRPVPYTLHSFTCSHVDGLWPRPLYVFIYECCYVGRNIYSPGLWDSHPCSAWSMRGNTKSKAERLLGAGGRGWVQLCSWVLLALWGLCMLCYGATWSPESLAAPLAQRTDRCLPRSHWVCASVESKLEMLWVALLTICTMMLKRKTKNEKNSNNNKNI